MRKNTENERGRGESVRGTERKERGREERKSERMRERGRKREGERERVLHAVTQMFAQYGCGKLQGTTGRE